MKKITLTLSLSVVLALCFISSCGLFEDAKNFDFDTEVVIEFVVDESEENSAGKAYMADQVLDIKSDPEVLDYASKIKDVKVNKITYYVYMLSHTGVTFSSGSLTTLSNGKTIASLANLPLTEEAFGNFSVDGGGFSELSARLKGLNPETIRFQGFLSETPVSFYVMCTFHVTVTAEAF